MVLQILAFDLDRSCPVGICGTCSKYEVLLVPHVTVTLDVTSLVLCISMARGKVTLRTYPLLRVPTHPFRALGAKVLGRYWGELSMCKYQG